MKKKYLLYAFFPILALTLLIGGTTYAASVKTVKNNPFNSIATAIAKKFNLTTTEVQSVIDETMAVERAHMEKNRPVRVDPVVQAVKDGKLTQAQADLIIAKKAELKASVNKQQDMTQADRETIMKTHKEILKQWAITNNIPEQYIMMGVGGAGAGRGGEKGLGFSKNIHPKLSTQKSAK